MKWKTTRLLFFLLNLWFGSFCYGQIFENQNPDGAVEFVENQGQWDGEFLFLTQLPNGHLFFENNTFTYNLRNEKQWSKYMLDRHDSSFRNRTARTIDQHAFHLKCLNANPKPYVLKQHPFNHYYNYFLSDKSVSGVKPYGLLLYNNIYENIDLVINGLDGSIKYEWNIAPGPKRHKLIKMEIVGVDTAYLFNGNLILQTSVGNVIETKPLAYQTLQNTKNSKDTVECYFSLENNILSYTFPNGYNENLPLTIDPKLIFSTYSGARGDNFGFTATYDSKANLYAGGISNGAQGQYPVTLGAFQRTYGGSGPGRGPVNLPCDITISKYDSAGTSLLWASYLGGSDDEFPHSLVVDENDNLFVFGTTYSNDFPTTPNAYDNSFNDLSKGTDIIVSRISENGKILMASTFIGGSAKDGLNEGALHINYADDFRGDIIPDNKGDIYIATCTRSKDFPMVDPVDSTIDNLEGVLLKLDLNLTKLKWSTFIGGKGQDALYSVKVDLDSTVFVGGGTNSNSLPALGGINPAKAGGSDGFISKLNRKTHKLDRSTFFGTAQYDQIYFIDYDGQNSLYLAGQTSGNIAPSSSSKYGSANSGQFIAKIDTSFNKLEWETSFGTGGNLLNLSPSAFLVDNCEHIYYSGWARFDGGTTNGLETTSDALFRTTDGSDFYLAVLNKNAEGLLYATFFGGNETGDHVDGGTSRFDKKGVVYQSVCSSCPAGSEPGHQDFPISPNAVFIQNFSPRCSNASFKIDLQVTSAVVADFTPDPTKGCAPLTVAFRNRSTIVDKYYWDFGDGSPLDSTNFNPTHTFKEPGEYTVVLIVIDSNSCNISDEYKRKIQVLSEQEADFTYEVEPCSYKVQFESKSSSSNLVWRFIDDSISTKTKFTKQYKANQVDSVWLIVEPGTICSDSVLKVITMVDQITSNYIIPNFFSPNGDGINDEFCLDGFTANCDEIEWFIYNRWGERVFHSKDIFDCWDGKVKNTGKSYPDGTYFAIYKIKNKTEDYWDTISGQVTIVRQ